MAQHGGKLEGVLFGKILNDDQLKTMVWDIERGVPNDTLPYAWQTDTCIGGWHYDRSLYDRGRYKSAKTVIQMLCNIVSKNGNLLLNIPVRGDGTIDDKEEAVLNGIAAWMDVNKECIFGTRPWKIFGEGPASEGAALSAQGFNEGKGKPFTAEDIRFTTKDGTLYAIILAGPGDKETHIKSLAKNSPQLEGRRITGVSLLGHAGSIDWSQTDTDLTVKAPGDNVIVLKIKGAL
jgi:alpha-L-fucosidase